VGRGFVPLERLHRLHVAVEQTAEKSSVLRYASGMADNETTKLVIKGAVKALGTVALAGLSAYHGLGHSSLFQFHRKQLEGAALVSTNSESGSNPDEQTGGSRSRHRIPPTPLGQKLAALVHEVEFAKDLNAVAQ
jgi:hypothetical protein